MCFSVSFIAEERGLKISGCFKCLNSKVRRSDDVSYQHWWGGGSFFGGEGGMGDFLKGNIFQLVYKILNSLNLCISKNFVVFGWSRNAPVVQ